MEGEDKTRDESYVPEHKSDFTKRKQASRAAKIQAQERRRKSREPGATVREGVQQRPMPGASKLQEAGMSKLEE